MCSRKGYSRLSQTHKHDLFKFKSGKYNIDSTVTLSQLSALLESDPSEPKMLYPVCLKVSPKA